LLINKKQKYFAILQTLSQVTKIHSLIFCSKIVTLAVNKLNLPDSNRDRKTSVTVFLDSGLNSAK